MHMYFNPSAIIESVARKENMCAVNLMRIVHCDIEADLSLLFFEQIVAGELGTRERKNLIVVGKVLQKAFNLKVCDCRAPDTCHSLTSSCSHHNGSGKVAHTFYTHFFFIFFNVLFVLL